MFLQKKQNVVNIQNYAATRNSTPKIIGERYNLPKNFCLFFFSGIRNKNFFFKLSVCRHTVENKSTPLRLFFFHCFNITYEFKKKNCHLSNFCLYEIKEKNKNNYHIAYCQATKLFSEIVIFSSLFLKISSLARQLSSDLPL